MTVYASYDVTLGSSPEALPRKRRSLASRFLLVAFAVMVIGMLALGTLVSWQIEKSVAEIKAASTALYVNTVLAPHLQEIAPDDALSDQTIDALQHALGRPDLQALVASVKVWNKDGLIVYSNQRDLIGEKPAPNTPLKMAWEGIISAEFDESYDDIDAGSHATGRPLLRVLAPIRDFNSGNVIAVVEFHERADALNAELAAAEWKTWLTTALITLNMMGCLFVIVANGSKTIDRQREALKRRVAQLSELLHQNSVLQRRIERAARNATEDNERLLRRMGYDLHDGVAQLISLALLRIDRVKGAEGDQENLQKIQKAMSDALNDTRNICKGLLLPEIQRMTLPEALMFMIRQHERRTNAAIVCNIRTPLPDQAPQFVKIALCRHIQESLNNAFKHAGGREHEVNIEWDGAAITVEVADKGPGICDTGSKHDEPRLGLSGLRDRIESIGGELSIRSAPDVGTRIKASLPLGGQDAA